MIAVDIGSLDGLITRRFATPHLVGVRPVVGEADVALVVEEHHEGSRGRIWAMGEEPASLLPFPVGVGSLLTNDGRWIVDLADDGGSEVGSLVARTVDGAVAVDLIPGREPFILRGLETSFDGTALVATVVDEAGFHVLKIPALPWGPPRVVFSSPIEAWYGQISPDGSLISVDTTDHNPGIRRTALTIVDTETLEIVAVMNDLPGGPVRGVRFSSIPGDDRLLANTERSGFARPVIWDVRAGTRRDFFVPDIFGDVIPLDWHAPTGKVLAVHVQDGEHRLIELDERDDAIRVVLEGGSFADPDVAASHPFQWASYYSPAGRVRAIRSSWDVPAHLVEVGSGGEVTGLIDAAAVPPGVAFTSTMVPSADGTRVQVWLGMPPGREPLGTVLEVHGGPNLVAVDAYNPSAQSWIDAGFAYASLNYRGSVTFGRAFREGLWGAGGDREVEDITGAMEWLRDHGLAEPASSFITGASFGGHLTLLSAGRMPDMFAGGFAHVAVADWSAAMESMNPAVRSVWSSWVPPDMVEHFSAVTYVDEVTASLWLNQGALDTRTPIVGVQRFVDRLAGRGGDVVMDVFDGGHIPTGLAVLEHDQRRMLDFALRTRAGRRWDDGAPR